MSEESIALKEQSPFRYYIPEHKSNSRKSTQHRVPCCEFCHGSGLLGSRQNHR